MTMIENLKYKTRIEHNRSKQKLPQPLMQRNSKLTKERNRKIRHKMLKNQSGKIIPFLKLPLQLNVCNKNQTWDRAPTFST